MIPFAPQLYILAFVALSSFATGWRLSSNVTAAKVAKVEAAAQAAYLKKTEELYDVATKYEELRSKRSVAAKQITRTVTQIVANPMYQRECFDDAGVRAANAALLVTPDTAEPSEQMRPTSTP